jgi:hypothetical protein
LERNLNQDFFNSFKNVQCVAIGKNIQCIKPTKWECMSGRESECAREREMAKLSTVMHQLFILYDIAGWCSKVDENEHP